MINNTLIVTSPYMYIYWFHTDYIICNDNAIPLRKSWNIADIIQIDKESNAIRNHSYKFLFWILNKIDNNYANQSHVIFLSFVTISIELLLTIVIQKKRKIQIKPDLSVCILMACKFRKSNPRSTRRQDSKVTTLLSDVDLSAGTVHRHGTRKM